MPVWNRWIKGVDFVWLGSLLPKKERSCLIYGKKNKTDTMLIHTCTIGYVGLFWGVCACKSMNEGGKGGRRERHTYTNRERERERECVCVRERERERASASINPCIFSFPLQLLYWWPPLSSAGDHYYSSSGITTGWGQKQQECNLPH